MMPSIDVICAVCSVASRRLHARDTLVNDIHVVWNPINSTYVFTVECHGETDWCSVPKYLFDLESGWKISEAVAFRGKMGTGTVPEYKKEIMSIANGPTPASETTLAETIRNTEESKIVTTVNREWAPLEGDKVDEPDGGICRLPQRGSDIENGIFVPDYMRCM